MDIRQVTTLDEINMARQLFEEYEASLDVSLCFQNFAEELASLPGDYAPPSGCLLLCFSGSQVAGCVALRRLEKEVCEMKRLYVRPSFRGLGIGKMLVKAVIEQARQKEYHAMRLDTLPIQERAHGLYIKAGFLDIDSYRHNPVDGVRYMELDLVSYSSSNNAATTD